LPSSFFHANERMCALTFMAWNDRLLTGIEAVDTDHRKLVEILNRLYGGMQSGLGREVLDDLFDELLDYTQYHFAREERLFERYDYPLALEHAFAHAKMAKWCTEARADFKRGELPGPSLQVLSYLKDWLFDHIMETDKRFAEYVAARKKY